MKNDKKKQIRRTFADTKKAQNELRQLIIKKIDESTGLTVSEKENWLDLIADSFLSIGTDQKVFIDKPHIRIAFGSIHTFALRFLDWSNPVKYKYNGNSYVFSINELWQKLYDCCLEAFPYALADAIHMSKEIEERESWKGYGFSKETDLEE